MYEESVFRPDLLERREFWALHAWLVTRGPTSNIDYESVDSLFGFTEDHIYTFCKQETHDEFAWPCFRVQLPSGYFADIDFCNLPDDCCYPFSINHSDWSAPIEIAVSMGNFFVPAFRWKELLAISENAIGSDQRKASSQALLLLLPVMWVTRDDDSTEIKHCLAQAISVLKLAKQSNIDFLAEKLIEALRADLRWRHDDKLGWVNDGSYSTRNPNRTIPLSLEEFSRIREFFRAVGL